MKNAFEEVNCARCFNHTLQLSAKTLLKPFNAGMSLAQMTVDEEETPGFNDEVPTPTLLDDDAGDDEDDNDNDNEGFHEEDLGNDEEPGNEDGNEDDDGIDELEDLDEEERKKILADTAVVRQTVSKVCINSF